MSVLSDRCDLANQVVTGTVAQTSASESSARAMRVRALPGRGSAKPHSDKVFRRLNAFLFVVAIQIYSIGLVAWRYGGSRLEFLDQSDTIQPFMIMRDAFRDPSSLLDWYTSPALYAFPDCVLTGLLLMLPVDIRLLPMLYGGVMVAGYAFASAGILRVYARIHWMSATLIATAMLTLLLVWYCPPAKFASGIASYSFAAFFHTGALLAGFLLIAGLGLMVGRQKRPVHLIASLTTVVFLVSLSDAIFLPWFAIPASFAATLYLAVTRTVVPASVVLVAVASVVGVVVDKLAHHVPYGSPPSDFAATFQSAQLLLLQSVRSVDLALLVPLVLAPVMLARGAALLVRGARSRYFCQGDLGELILVGCFLAALATPLVTGRFLAVSALRYSQPIFLLPYLWCVLAIVRVLPSPFKRALPLASALLLLFVTLRHSPAAIAGTHHFSALRQPAVCLLENGLTEGYAGYWQTKSVMWNSNHRLHLFQILPNGDMKPYRANYNARWFRTNAQTGAPLRPNFVIVFGLDQGNVHAKFGDPSRKIMCGIYPVWIYDQALPLLD